MICFLEKKFALFGKTNNLQKTLWSPFDPLFVPLSHVIVLGYVPKLNNNTSECVAVRHNQGLI